MDISEIDKIERDLHRLLTKAMAVIDNADIEDLRIENTADMDRIGRVVGNCAKALSELAKRRTDRETAIAQAAQNLKDSVRSQLQGHNDLVSELIEVIDTATRSN